MSDEYLAGRLAAALVEIARIRLVIDCTGSSPRGPSEEDMRQLMDGIEGGLLEAWREHRRAQSPASHQRVSEVVTAWHSLWLAGLE
jgi:hypothetical protein